MAIVDSSWPRADVWLAREDAEPQVMVVGVPSSKASLSPSRADLTPGAVRERLGRFSTFHSELGIDFHGVRVADLGNWAVSELDMHEMPERVEDLARELPVPPVKLFLGGDNAITRPLVRSLGDPGGVGIISFDAHHDVRTLAFGPSNGTSIRGLIEVDGVPAGNVHQIGIHSFANSAAYRSYCDEMGVLIHPIRELEEAGVAGTVDRALGDLADRCSAIYVDVDIDVLDSAFAPGCPGARPGGMNLRDLAESVYRCARHPKVAAVDFVEVDAAADPLGITLDAMAHLFLTAVTGVAVRQ